MKIIRKLFSRVLTYISTSDPTTQVCTCRPFYRGAILDHPHITVCPGGQHDGYQHNIPALLTHTHTEQLEKLQWNTACIVDNSDLKTIVSHIFQIKLCEFNRDGDISHLYTEGSWDHNFQQASHSPEKANTLKASNTYPMKAH